MSPTLDFADLRHGRVLLLELVGGMGNRPGNGVVLLSREKQQRSALGLLGVHLGFRPGIEIGGGSLKERHARTRPRKGLLQLVSFVFLYGVGQTKTEQLVVQWDGTGNVAPGAPDWR